ncbi:MAG: ACT domain-containing protein [Oscillospiraceae bacterium]|nr:ACT domain-containing protein [Oscillospiraceae bacterium]
MGNANRYIVDAAVLPEIFLRVSEAKEYLQTGAARTVADAAAMAGVSRSAFYKYRDAITPFRDMKRDSILTMTIITQDRPGALSSVLAIFAESGANILTINQTIPTNGVGMVTISFTTENTALSPDALCARIESLPDISRLEILAG